MLAQMSERMGAEHYERARGQAGKGSVLDIDT
jgi:hypothetical protein